MRPGWPTSRNEVPSKRNTGLRGEGAGIVHDETERRKEEDAPAAAVVQQPAAVAAAAGGTGPIAPPVEPPVLPDIIDRWHKWAFNRRGAYIYVGLDHDGVDGQEPPANPGFAPPGMASSINGAYQKALSMLSVMKPDGRVIIVVHAGEWHENLDFTSSQIDLEGRGEVMVRGLVTILPTACKMTVTNIRFKGTDLFLKPMHVRQRGPGGIPESFPYSDIKFLDCKFSGPIGGFFAERRVFLYGCEFDRDVSAPPLSEDATFIIQADRHDVWWSHAINCRFHSSYEYIALPTPISMPNPNLSIRKPTGFAIKATSKQDGIYPMPPDILPAITSDGVLSYAHPTSGLLLINCEIEGSLLCEAMNVEHKNCNVTAGYSIGIAVAGGIYARVRGWRFGDVSNALGGRVFFDHSRVQAECIAQFVRDPLQPTNPYSFGGKVFFRHSTHLGHYESQTGSPFTTDGAVGSYDIVCSSTSSTSWLVAGLAGQTFGNCPTSTSDPGIFHALYDPYYL
jgi:hypothetical protein